MPRVAITLDCPVHDSLRVRQVADMFDLPLKAHASESFSADLPDAGDRWTIGAIVGPSGSGKSTVARHAFGDCFYVPRRWRANQAVVDGFGNVPIQTITRTLTSVGFSSPPAWLKPYQVLSNGERFRCDLARALLSEKELVVFDEFTSCVDRTVARISSAAISKAIRQRTGSGSGFRVQGSVEEGIHFASAAVTRSGSSKSESDPRNDRPARTTSFYLNPEPQIPNPSLNARFVAVTCHYDVLDWLCPDWILDMATQTLARRSVRRPSIELRITRCGREQWRTFSRHHYLSGEIHPSAQCFLGSIDGRSAAFTATLPFPHPRRPGWREHRTVCLPDFQGVGIGNAMSEFVAALYRAAGRPYFSTTSHPAMIQHRVRSLLWRTTRKPGRVHPGGAASTARYMTRSASTNRITAGFEYIGPGRMKEARLLGLS